MILGSILGVKMGLRFRFFLDFSIHFFKMRPRDAQEAPKSAPRVPKSVPRAPPECPKSACERPKSAPGVPQERPKSVPGAFKSALALGHPKMLQIGFPSTRLRVLRSVF